MAELKGSKILVTGAGGFIGHHLVSYLKSLGYWVRGADLKYPEFEPTTADEFVLCDLRRFADCLQVTYGIDEIYALASDVGGAGYLYSHQAEILYNNSLIDMHTLEAARTNRVSRYLYASSACVYPVYRQKEGGFIRMKEEDAFPAEPQDDYGWQKLSTERICQRYRDSYSIQTHVARFFNVYGPLDIWQGGRERAFAALCRKIAMSKLRGDPELEIWGDGEQTRSFCYVDDCILGIYKLMQSNYAKPLNLGSTHLVRLNALVDIIASIADVQVSKKYISGPQGSRHLGCDTYRLRKTLGWEPSTPLEEGLTHTYSWIESQISKGEMESK